MQPAQCFIHHAPGHLWEPEIGSGEDSEDGGHAHHHVEVADDEVGGMQVNVDRRLREEESADAAADKHGDESDGRTATQN